MTGKRHKSILCEFMAFKTGHPFTMNTIFNQETLLEITPKDVCHWMNSRPFGDSNSSEDAKPVNARSSTLEYAIKAISSFMPRHTNPIRNEGNPTRSEVVNTVIKNFVEKEFNQQLGVRSSRMRFSTFSSKFYP
ncbi:LOW QUALITY PROTEIN: hypothetical protein PHPALM_30699 [Phytophthora palmivora]|uniref:Uncharacterized protein n=1 Tax=Phytophthora palmivora TaxID=4796 RepID=A0A2P4X4I6_9STRA|nr:LOW QUALITY PROTEIN: hypothetical protein PHPALM_30699 [Phytophthora palmivora]